MKLYVILALILTSYVCDAYRILVVFPLPGKSHNILGNGHVRHLLNAGHEVYFITPFLRKKPPPNLMEVDVSYNMKMFDHTGVMLNIEKVMNKEINPSDINAIFSMFSAITYETIKNENVQKVLLDPNLKFDAVIAEWMFGEFYAGLAEVLECPLIWFSSVDPHWIIMSLIDETLNPAYSPDIQSSSVTPFNFVQRVTELGNQVMGTLLRELYVRRAEKAKYEEIYHPLFAQKGRTPPAYEDIIYNASLVLGNSHPALGEAIRLPQNYKAIAGYHIDDNLKPLPEDLKKIIEGAKHGVIYFSMGSNLKSKDMPKSLKDSLLKMFGTLKYTVLWKFEEKFPNLPSNVHILEWAPQPSILAHPNCVLFITHGGLLSTTETVHYGVPVIGVPVFADQFINVNRAVKKGFALRVDLSYTMADELKEAINTITTDPKYRQKVKELSFIYHHRPASPGMELVHWTEHVILTRGAPHLRSPALHVPWYQKMYLDLAALVVIVLLLIRQAFIVLCCKSRKSDLNKKNK